MEEDEKPAADAADEVEKKVEAEIEKGAEVKDFYTLSIEDLGKDVEFVRAYLKMLTANKLTMEKLLGKINVTGDVAKIEPTVIFLNSLFEFFKQSETKFTDMLASLSGRLLIMKKMKESFDKSVKGEEMKTDNGERM